MAPGRPIIDGDIPVDKVAISGPTLAVLMQAVNSSQGDCDGILFGHVDRHTTANIVDEDMGPQTSEESTATVTGHYCSGRVNSFYDATGRIDSSKLAEMIGDRESRGGDDPIGWFVGRRGTTMRPSMRESTVTAYLRTIPFYVPQAAVGGSGDLRNRKGKGTLEGTLENLSAKSQTADGGGNVSIAGDPASADSPMQEGGVRSSGETHAGDGTSFVQVDSKLIGVPPSSPCILFLFTESCDSNSIHTHEYRAFQYRMRLSGVGCFEPRSVSIVNIGPAFRGLYDSFAPVAPFPWFSKSADTSGDSPDEGLRRLADGRVTDVLMKGPQEAEQALLDMYTQDFAVDRLHSLVRTEGAGGSVGELEALYRTMLRKLEVLAKQVCEGNDAIAEQELANEKLKTALMSAGKR